MIRILRPSDVARLLFLRPAEGGTQAFTLDSAAHSSASAYRPNRYIASALTWRARRDGWIAFGSSGVTGVVRVRRRNGPTVWEISELFLSPDARPEMDGAELLSDLADVASRLGIHRVFLRIGDGNPMATAARRAGYTLQTRETLYHLPEDLRRQGQSTPYPGESGWRTVTDEDLQRVFRLYGSATPLSVRETAGMTLPEWRDSLEPLPHAPRGNVFGGGRTAAINSGEMVLDGEQGPLAWMRFSDASNERLFTLMVEPEADLDMDEVVHGVLAGGFGKPAAMLVPLYARRIAVALAAAEFVPGHDYELFARQTAERAKIPRNTMVAAGG
ncbi:MAG: hypothetical protein QGI84_08765 [Dehalococcoidia bacterium]|nr:hypothetical protein [Dehalococcoidia bacterium]